MVARMAMVRFGFKGEVDVRDVFVQNSIDQAYYFQFIKLLYPCTHCQTLGQLSNKASTTNQGFIMVAETFQILGQVGDLCQVEI